MVPDEDSREETKLDQYGNLYSAMLNEGDGYYFYGYESDSTYSFDPELQARFQMARDSLESFKELLEERIIGEGGDPADYEI